MWPGRSPLESLRLYLLGGFQGGLPLGAKYGIFAVKRAEEYRLETNDEDEGGRAKDANRARTTGAALEAHYRFVLWLVPTVERFPRKQKFLLGERIQATALDVLERLIEATYTRQRRGRLADANLGLEKLRFLFRLARDLRILDYRRYEYAARSIDETGRRVGAWNKAHNAQEIGERRCAGARYARRNHRKTKAIRSCWRSSDRVAELLGRERWPDWLRRFCQRTRCRAFSVADSLARDALLGGNFDFTAWQGSGGVVACFRGRTPIASWRNAGELMVANRTIADLLRTMENDL